MLRTDAELEGPRQEIRSSLAGGGIVRRDIVKHDPLRGAFMPATDIRASRGAFQHHRDAVKVVVPGMEDVTAHLVEPYPSTDAVEQYLSKAAVSSEAICWGLRPSIMCRCTKWTTSPSLRIAIDGLDGW